MEHILQCSRTHFWFYLKTICCHSVLSITFSASQTIWDKVKSGTLIMQNTCMIVTVEFQTAWRKTNWMGEDTMFKKKKTYWATDNRNTVYKVKWIVSVGPQDNRNGPFSYYNAYSEQYWRYKKMLNSHLSYYSFHNHTRTKAFNLEHFIYMVRKRSENGFLNVPEMLIER